MKPSPNGERTPLLSSHDPSSYLASALNYGSPYRSENHSQLAGREDLEPSPPTHIQDIEEVRKERQALEKICTKTSR